MYIQSGSWEINNEQIRHLHTNLRAGETIEFGRQLVCDKCNALVPWRVRRLASRYGGTMANMATAQEAAGANVKFAQGVPEEAANIGKFRTEQVSYTCIYFDEKPDAAARTLLKGAGFRYQPQMDNAWFGETKNLPKQFMPEEDSKES